MGMRPAFDPTPPSKIAPPPWWCSIWPMHLAYWRGMVDAMYATFEGEEDRSNHEL